MQTYQKAQFINEPTYWHTLSSLAWKFNTTRLRQANYHKWRQINAPELNLLHISIR